MELTPEQREQLENALLSAFDFNDMQRMLRLKLGYKIEEEMGTNDGFKYVVTRLVDKATDGWLDKLLMNALAYRPGSNKLRAIVRELEIEDTEKPEPAVVEVQNGVGSRLEKIVRKQEPSVDFSHFVVRLNSLSAKICRIEYPVGRPQGTGWLVGPDLILTNYHVIEMVNNGMNGLESTDIHCLFDFHSAEVNNRMCKLSDNWLVDYSPYSQADLSSGNKQPSENELDYALIRLKEHVGDDILKSGASRGTLVIPEIPAVMSANDLVVIPQHPDGRKLEIAFGAVISYNSVANRVRYDANTEPGSSGSPCLGINLVPFALHHAQGPRHNLKYNQGIPLRQIVKAMKAKNTVAFWRSD